VGIVVGGVIALALVFLLLWIVFGRVRRVSNQSVTYVQLIGHSLQLVTPACQYSCWCREQQVLQHH
jgi:hypothetical protein